jgi:hypothetical protein
MPDVDYILGHSPAEIRRLILQVMTILMASSAAAAIVRLQYLDQRLAEYVHIAMKPLAGYGGIGIDFTVANCGASLMLIGGDPGRIVALTTRFEFVLPGNADAKVWGSR